jgi:hypothetical protein
MISKAKRDDSEFDLHIVKNHFSVGNRSLFFASLPGTAISRLQCDGSDLKETIIKDAKAGLSNSILTSLVNDMRSGDVVRPILAARHSKLILYCGAKEGRFPVLHIDVNALVAAEFNDCVS